MAPKLKPSSKEYKRDRNGRMTNQWTWKHFTVSGISTKELKELYNSSNMKRKKNVILRELEKRNEVNDK